MVDTPASASALRDFCRAQGINAVYISGFDLHERSVQLTMSNLIAELHAANIRVEALFSSTDADEPGKHREKLLQKVRSVVWFDRDFSGARFDGIHLDIEPQQRPRTKAPATSGSYRISWTHIERCASFQVRRS